MPQLARLVLWRPRPPFRLVASVGRISVSGFREVFEGANERVVAATRAAGKALPVGELHRAFTGADFIRFADLVTVGQPPGYFGDWLGRYQRINARNMEALLAASRAAEGPGRWTWMIDRAVPDPAARPTSGGQGGIVDDVLALCAIVPGLTFDQVMERWSAQTFFEVCAAVISFGKSRAAVPAVSDAPLPMDQIRRMTVTGRVH